MGATYPKKEITGGKMFSGVVLVEGLSRGKIKMFMHGVFFDFKS